MADEASITTRLTKRWSRWMDDSEIGYWLRQLRAYDLDRVDDLLTEFMQSEAGKPRWSAFQAFMLSRGVRPAGGSGESSTRAEQWWERCKTFTGQIMGQAEPERERAEAELVLRYHRRQFFRARQSILFSSLVEQRAATDRERAELNVELLRCRRMCQGDLFTLFAPEVGRDGITEAERRATDTAAWIDAGEAEFESVVMDCA